MLDKLEIRSGDYYGGKETLPSAQDTLRQATLRLGGPSGELVKIEDIRYYLGARLLCHLESGDRASNDYQLLQKAQDISSPTGVHAAIEIFKAQFESLKEELSTTPKNTRSRDLVREGVALGLSIIRLEKEMLPKSQKPTVEKKPVAKADFEDRETARGQFELKKLKTGRAAFDVWNQPVGHKITEKEVDLLLDASWIITPVGRDPALSELVYAAVLDLVKKAKDFRNNKEGRGAVVKLVNTQAETIISTTRRLNPPDADEKTSRVRHAVASVKELMGELEKGGKRY